MELDIQSSLKNKTGDQMKNKIFFTLFAVVAFFSFTTFTFGQQKKPQNVKPQEKQAVEVKDDRFSGDRTVTLT